MFAKEVLWCCSANLHVQKRQRRDVCKDDIKLFQGLCGLAEEKPDATLVDEAWEKLPMLTTRAMASLLQAWDKFTDDHHQVALSTPCYGHR